MGANSKMKYLVLQVHYASTDHIEPQGDDSGVILQYTQQEQPKTAGVLLLGTGGSAPAHSTTYFETACQIQDSRAIHPFAFRTHTHSLGRQSITATDPLDLSGREINCSAENNFNEGEREISLLLQPAIQ